MSNLPQLKRHWYLLSNANDIDSVLYKLNSISYEVFTCPCMRPWLFPQHTTASWHAF